MTSTEIVEKTLEILSSKQRKDGTVGVKEVISVPGFTITPTLFWAKEWDKIVRVAVVKKTGDSLLIQEWWLTAIRAQPQNVELEYRLIGIKVVEQQCENARSENP